MDEKKDYWWRDSIEFSARTHVGMRRRTNQDSYCVAPAKDREEWKSRGHFFLVADGMGAHVAGELASKMAATIVPEAYLRRANQPTREALRDAVFDAHLEIRKRGEEEAEYRDMGTTCDALAVTPEGAYVAHVGDSRVYRARDAEIEQLTFDHSLAWEVKYYPTSHSAFRQIDVIPKNIITRSLGPTESLVVDAEGPVDVRSGDVFLLCSDGLSGRVNDSELGQLLELLSPNDATEALVNLANLRGGPDNVTAIVVRVKDWDGAASSRAASRPRRSASPSRMRVAVARSLAALSALGGAVALLAGTGNWKHVGAALLAGSCFAAFVGIFGGRRRETPGSTPPDAEKDARRGPYARASAIPSEEFANKMAELCDQLCETVKKEPRYEPDWDGVERALALAQKAREEKDYGSAIRGCVSVVNYMMREVQKFANAHRSTTHSRAQTLDAR